MARAIITLSAAQSDIRRTTSRIARTVSPRSATHWHANILARIRLLADRAESWPLAEESDDLGLPLREMLFGKRRHIYRILFTIENEIVYIYHVRYAAQDRLTEDDV